MKFWKETVYIIGGKEIWQITRYLTLIIKKYNDEVTWLGLS